MTFLSTLNKPLNSLICKENFSTTSRLLNNEEIEILRKEISIMLINNDIHWFSFYSYIPSLIVSFYFFYTTKNILYAILSFVIVFLIYKVIPFFMKGDSNLLKEDLKEGRAFIKTGPLNIVVDDHSKTYMKRLYLDDVIIDGIYSRGEELKYPNLKNGQSITVTYSPQAHQIFSVIPNE